MKKNRKYCDEEKKNYHLKLPLSVHKKLKIVAEENNRSVSSEILHILKREINDKS